MYCVAYVYAAHVNLGTLFVASLWSDLLMFAFDMIGLESGRYNPNKIGAMQMVTRTARGQTNNTPQQSRSVLKQLWTKEGHCFRHALQQQNMKPCLSIQALPVTASSSLCLF